MTQPTKPTASEQGALREENSLDALAALRSPELDALNRAHDYPLRASSPAAVPAGVFGRFRLRLRSWLLGDYFRAEQEYQAHLVRHLNDVASRLERSLVRLEDRREGSNYTLERRFGAELERVRAELQAALGTGERARADTETRLGTIESVARGLERIVAALRPAAGAESAPAAEVKIDYRYLLLENRFRGSEEEIESRLRPYLKLFASAGAPVFELGSGRGELQRLFHSVRIPSYGYEQDQAMAERCEADGLDVRLGDGIEHLRTVAPKSLGGFIAVQVVEHLPLPVLRELLGLLAVKLRPGAPIVLETINSESLLALSHNYFRDPTHVAPLHPDTLRFLVEMSGLEVKELRRLSPYPEAAQLRELSSDTFLGPRMRESIEILNANVRLLNGILFGHQDYCVVAAVPGSPS